MISIYYLLVCIQNVTKGTNSESMKNANKVNIVIVNLSQCLLYFCIMIYDLFLLTYGWIKQKKITPLLRYDICDEIFYSCLVDSWLVEVLVFDV